MRMAGILSILFVAVTLNPADSGATVLHAPLDRQQVCEILSDPSNGWYAAFGATLPEVQGRAVQKAVKGVAPRLCQNSGRDGDGILATLEQICAKECAVSVADVRQQGACIGDCPESIRHLRGFFAGLAFADRRVALVRKDLACCNQRVMAIRNQLRAEPDAAVSDGLGRRISEIIEAAAPGVPASGQAAGR
jgi:hypothetical protein